MEGKREFVYFFKHKGIKGIKIGMTTTTSIKERFNNFKTYSPYGAEIIGVIPTTNAIELERTLHEKFKNRKIKGEFYDICKKNIEHLIYYNDLKTELLNIFYIMDYEDKLKSIKAMQTIYNTDVKLDHYNDLYLKFETDIIPDTIYNKTEFCNNILESHKYRFKSNTLTKIIKRWCNLNDYEYINKTVNNKRCFLILK